MPVLGRIDPAAAWRQAWHRGSADRDLRDRSEPYQRERHAEHRSGDGGADAILLRGSRVCTQPTAEILSAKLSDSLRDATQTCAHHKLLIFQG